jgi:predicted GNAT family acetyltransferase
LETSVKLKVNYKKGRFYIEIDGKTKTKTKMTFVFVGPDKTIIDPTEVNEGNKGKGFSKTIATKAVDFVKEKNREIIPLCPFATNIFDKTPDYNDVL